MAYRFKYLPNLTINDNHFAPRKKTMLFPVSGVQAYPTIPAIVEFCVSSITEAMNEILNDYSPT
ncbi:uncharacterized protein Dvar_14150 [Desulfosarcina variabilis str. Montpellier]